MTGLQQKLMGKEDWPMSVGWWTDRYETLIDVKQHLLFEDQYKIHEKDCIKGERITIIDKNTGAIIRETK